jgi:hypothetical protein
MQMLPSSSPLLHTLKLKLRISFDEYEFPHGGFCDLVETMNLIHLPVLATLNLSVAVDLEEDDGSNGNLDLLPSANFSAFLATHTTLLDLTLSARGTKLTKDITFLPHLRSFEGSFEDAAVVCASQRPLEKLVLTLVHSMWSDELLPSSQPLPLASHLSLTNLRVLAVDSFESEAKLTDELTPASFAQLVSSFPNLTHLDVCISDQIVRPLCI